MKKLFSFAMLITTLLILFGFTQEIYTVYCLSLDASFFIPPDREHIIKYGKKVESSSSELNSLISSLSHRQSMKVTTEDLGRLRILIVRNSDQHEFLITSDKKIIDLDKKYDLEEKVIDNVLIQIGCGKEPKNK
jgi:hypothetical protein